MARWPLRLRARFGCWSRERIALTVLVLAPVLFNAVTLLPEVTKPVPSLNDDAYHFLLIQRASDALANNESLLDFWSPAVELGFPPFLLYQHLPHLTVVLLNRLMLQRVDLLDTFNGVRWLLLATFPITVWWSMRRMGFAPVAAAISAAGASLISGNHNYGFEYESYIWRGFGMFTQLWAMHLSFIALACMYSVRERGRGYFAAVLALTLLILSHTIYSYMMAISILVMYAYGLNRANLLVRARRLALVGVPTLIASSYFVLGFLQSKPYLNISLYLQREKYDSWGAAKILRWLFTGNLIDVDRLPVLSFLLGAGVVAALLTRRGPARLMLTLFVVWLLLYFGRTTWGPLADLLPLSDGLLMHRFIGSVEIAAVMLIGVGGEALYRLGQRVYPARASLALAPFVLVLLLPAFRERYRFYDLNTQWIERTQQALAADTDAQDILYTLSTLPPGRTYAGLWSNYARAPVMKFGDLNFVNVLTFYQLDGVVPPGGSLSLNSDLIWHFQDGNPAHFNLFNVTYVITPSNFTVPQFYKEVKRTGKYTLWQIETRGYAEFASAVTAPLTPASASDLFIQNRSWVLGNGPAAGEYLRWNYPPGRNPTGTPVASTCARSGQVLADRLRPNRLAALTDCADSGVVIFKTTYHPNWRVSIDGQPAQTFMASPSYLGVVVPPGRHSIQATYVASGTRPVLALLAVVTLAAVALIEANQAAIRARLRGRVANRLLGPEPARAAREAPE